LKGGKKNMPTPRRKVIRVAKKVQKRKRACAKRKLDRIEARIKLNIRELRKLQP
jgi:hypothetical protein